MKLKTTLLGKTYTFQTIKEVLAKANEEKTGDKLAGLAAESAQERVAAKVVLSALTLGDYPDHPGRRERGCLCQNPELDGVGAAGVDSLRDHHRR